MVWPFRRGRGSAPAASGGPVWSGCRDWASLPPIAPAVPAMELTIGTSSFEAGLPSRQDQRFLEPLGHQVSSSAPAGVITGLLSPTNTVPPSPGYPEAQRSAGAEQTARKTFSAPPWRGPANVAQRATEGEPPEVIPLPAPTPTLAGPQSLVRASTPPTLPALQLRATPTLPLSSEPGPSVGPEPPASPVPPLPPADETAAGEALRGDGDDAGLRRTSTGAVPLLGESPAAPPTSVLASTAEASPTLPLQLPSSEGAPQRQDAASPAPPEVTDRPRRLGLGPPLHARPSPIRVQRAAVTDGIPAAPVDGPSTDDVAPGPPPLAGEKLVLTNVEWPATERPSEPARPQEEGLAPLLFETPLPSGDASPPIPSPSLSHVPEPAAGGEAPSPSGPAGSLTVLPTLAARPVSLLSAQRSAAEDVPAPVRAAVEAETGADLAGAPVHRGPGSAETARELRARAFTVEGEVHLPSHHGPLGSGQASALLAHELVHVAQQRQLGSSRPSENSLRGQTLERQAQRVEHAVAQRLPLPSSPRPSRSTAATARSMSFGDPAAAALSTGLATLDPDGSVVFQTPPVPAGEPVPSATASYSGPQRAPEDAAPPAPTAAGPVAGGAPGGQSNEQLEELAKNLYDKIRERLKAELRLDRERCGRITDLAR